MNNNASELAAQNIGASSLLEMYGPLGCVSRVSLNSYVAGCDEFIIVDHYGLGVLSAIYAVAAAKAKATPKAKPKPKANAKAI